MTPVQELSGVAAWEEPLKWGSKLPSLLWNQVLAHPGGKPFLAIHVRDPLS